MITQNEEKNKTIWISTTGYRILLELTALIEAPKTIDELINIIKSDSLCKNSISIDTLRCDLSTLKKAGCVFLRASKANNYKYQLVSHPFVLNFNEEELNSFLELREIMSTDISLKDVFLLNELYEKISLLTFNEEIKQTVSETQLLSDISKTIVNEFSNPNIIGKKVQIRYNSPKYGEENTDIVPLKFIYENNKVYLVAYNYKYKHVSYFETSKIKKINSISIYSEKIPDMTFSVVYEIKGDALKNFLPEPCEKILEKTKDKIKIEAAVSNEFMFIQRLFLFGKDFRIISPDIFREKLILKIKSIQKRYKNDLC